MKIPAILNRTKRNKGAVKEMMNKQQLKEQIDSMVDSILDNVIELVEDRLRTKVIYDDLQYVIYKIEDMKFDTRDKLDELLGKDYNPPTQE